MKYLIFVCLFLLSCNGTANGQDKSRIPGVLFKDMNGKMISSTEAIQKGKPIIICFWASWCHPCIKELSAIAEVYKEWQNETGVILYAISVDDSRSFNNARVMINNNSWTFKFYFDTNSDFKRAMGAEDDRRRGQYGGCGCDGRRNHDGGARFHHVQSPVPGSFDHWSPPPVTRFTEITTGRAKGSPGSNGLAGPKSPG